MNRLKKNKRNNLTGHKEKGTIKKIRRNSKINTFDPKKNKMDPFTRTIIYMNKDYV